MTILDAGLIPPQTASDPIGFSPPYEKEEEVIAEMKQQNKASLFTLDMAIENVLLSASKINAAREPVVVHKQILAQYRLFAFDKCFVGD